MLDLHHFLGIMTSKIIQSRLRSAAEGGAMLQRCLAREAQLRQALLARFGRLGHHNLTANLFG